MSSQMDKFFLWKSLSLFKSFTFCMPEMAQVIWIYRIKSLEVLTLPTGSSEFLATFQLSFEDGSIQPVQREYAIANGIYLHPSSVCKKLVAMGFCQHRRSDPNVSRFFCQTHDSRLSRPYHFEANGTRINWNSTQLFQWSTSVLSESPLKSITFPGVDNTNRLHLFALAISPSISTLPASSSSDTTDSENQLLSIRRTRFTSRWEIINGVKAQAVEVTISNLLRSSLGVSQNTSINSNHSISIQGPGIETVSDGVFYRLVPGDQIRVDVFVVGAKDGVKATVLVQDTQTGKTTGQSDGWESSALIESWTTDPAVLSKHETPTWVSIFSCRDSRSL